MNNVDVSVIDEQNAISLLLAQTLDLRDNVQEGPVHFTNMLDRELLR